MSSLVSNPNLSPNSMEGYSLNSVTIEWDADSYSETMLERSSYKVSSNFLEPDSKLKEVILK